MLLGVNFTGLDKQSDKTRCIMALSMGKFATPNIGTGPFRTVNATAPFATAQFLNVFAHAAVSGGHSVGGPVEQSHYVPLHSLVIVEQIDLLVYTPDTNLTPGFEFYCDLYYESIRMSQADWADLRHRPPVEHSVIGLIAV